MDATSKAKFINSIVHDKKVPCPYCKTLNDEGSVFCISCGKKIDDIPNVDPQPKPIEEPTPIQQEVVHYEEPQSLFAEGLPSWSVEPPIMMVRRNKK